MKRTLWNLRCKFRIWWWTRKINKSYYYIERQSKWIDHRTKAVLDLELPKKEQTK